jgi:hypothetical protein
LRARVRWRSKGNGNTKEFFHAVGPKSSQAHITKLLDSNGTSYQEQDQLERICWDFYSNLYRERPPNQETAQVQAHLLDGVQSRFSQAMVEILKAPIQLAELSWALQDMVSHKSPGYDGVITEFYKALWPVIGNDFLVMIQESVLAGRLPRRMNDGVIALIPKAGHRNSLNHWRPITLLKVVGPICKRVPFPIPTGGPVPA